MVEEVPLLRSEPVPEEAVRVEACEKEAGTAVLVDEGALLMPSESVQDEAVSVEGWELGAGRVVLVVRVRVEGMVLLVSSSALTGAGGREG